LYISAPPYPAQSPCAVKAVTGGQSGKFGGSPMAVTSISPSPHPPVCKVKVATCAPSLEGANCTSARSVSPGCSVTVSFPACSVRSGPETATTPVTVTALDAATHVTGCALVRPTSVPGKSTDGGVQTSRVAQAPRLPRRSTLPVGNDGSFE